MINSFALAGPVKNITDNNVTIFAEVVSEKKGFDFTFNTTPELIKAIKEPLENGAIVICSVEGCVVPDDKGKTNLKIERVSASTFNRAKEVQA